MIKLFLQVGMNFGIILLAVSLLLFIQVNSDMDVTPKYKEEIVQETDSLQEEAYISCTCYGKSRRIKIPKYDQLKIYANLRTFDNYCKPDDKTEVCMLYKDCQNCSYHMAECHQSPIHKKYECLTKTLETNEGKDADNTKETLETDEGEDADNTEGTFATDEGESADNTEDPSGSRRRFKREFRYCPLPQTVTTYDLICRRYQSIVKCHQVCIRGYTLKKGVSRKRRCTYKENKWKPTDFKECQPYVDCGITMTRPGDVECFNATTTEDATCNVTCFASGDTPATPKETFTCGITGRWNKELPPCVIPKSGLKLVPPPVLDPYPFLDDLLKVQGDSYPRYIPSEYFQGFGSEDIS